ncbi:salicylate biosynthesis isochorismate synthase [Gallibacterium genomosp. 2]|uniref:Isochorismate synthase MenF n=1 Tax=Gallibacterium genomosp. 2 TaxID=155517 RepID=A0A0A2Y573_9PAST|nr:isochorismate synthase [Gallibacterium genomosp. 2]KGQ32604.1 salicylate biosynthesis isochorismate synthase [Gallibacterium genomosp. 2]
MDVFQQLKSLLTTQIAIYQPDCRRFGEIQASIEASNIDLIAWLKGQAVFPQFYLQQRQQQYEIAAVGAVSHITSFEELTTFKQDYPHFNLVGGVQFLGEVKFILPRIYLHYQQQKLTVKLLFNQRIWQQEKQQLLQILQQLPHPQTCNEIKDITPILHHQSSTQSQWRQLIQNALNAIKQQQFNKVVLARETVFQLNQPLNGYDLLALSRQTNQHCYHFAIAESAHSIFLGASPECLYCRTDSDFQTEALAGTAPIGETDEQQRRYQQWLLQDQKNRLENQFVVDDICQKIQPYCQTIEVGKVQLRQLRKVQHLCHPIKATLQPQHQYWEPLFALHPTAAVAGYPRQPALSFIKNNEPFQRNWYAGAIGVITQSFAEFCVGLRSAKLTNQQLHLFAGAGIVKESQADEEWLEIERKMSGLLSLFELK